MPVNCLGRPLVVSGLVLISRNLECKEGAVDSSSSPSFTNNPIEQMLCMPNVDSYVTQGKLVNFSEFLFALEK